jgi:hypothetical protein
MPDINKDQIETAEGSNELPSYFYSRRHQNSSFAFSITLNSPMSFRSLWRCSAATSEHSSRMRSISASFIDTVNFGASGLPKTLQSCGYSLPKA